MAHIRQSKPDSGLGVKAKDLKTFQVVPSALGSGNSSSTHKVFLEQVSAVD